LDLCGRALAEEGGEPCTLGRIGFRYDEAGFQNGRHARLLLLPRTIQQPVHDDGGLGPQHP
jgi:hypothetical protein